MREDEADEALAEAELVPVMEGTIPYMKELRDKCLAADIPVAIGCPHGKS